MAIGKLLGLVSSGVAPFCGVTWDAPWPQCPQTNISCILNPFINSREEKKKVKHRILALGDFPGGLVVKTLLSMQEAQVQSWVREQRSHNTAWHSKKKKKKKNPGPGMERGDLVPQGLCLPCRKSADILQF